MRAIVAEVERRMRCSMCLVAVMGADPSGTRTLLH
jgi:hypothetical protein